MARRRAKEKMEAACHHCGCGRWAGWVLLVAGVLWLLADYGSASWWKVNWWTLAALALGLSWVLKK